MSGDQVPGGWTSYVLEELVDPDRPITYGIVLPGPEPPRGGVPYVRVVDMADGTVRPDSLRHTTEEIAAKYKRSVLRAGDLLLSIRRHVGRLGFVPHGLDGANITQDTARLALVDSCHHRFVYWALNSVSVQRWMAKWTKGVAVTGINLGDVRKIPIALPALSEQRRITAILDEADALRRKRREALGLLDELMRSAFLEMFGDIPAKQTLWPWGTPRAFVAMSSGKRSKPVLAESATEYPVYGGNGIKGYATEPLYEKSVIVVGRVGQQCGITHLTDGPAWVTDNAIVVRVTDDSALDPVYLATAFQHAPIRDTVSRLDLPFINQDMLKDQPIPLPPIVEQRRFVDLRGELLAQKATVAHSLDELEGLFSSLVHRAFTGELTLRGGA